MLALDKLVMVQDAFRLEADLSLEAGRKVAVIGPSGAGKSTLLSTLAGFFAPLSGAIRWQGQPIDHLPAGARPLSILFQDQNLFPHLTLYQNLGLGIRPDLKLSPADQARIGQALARVGLEGFEKRLPAQLSGGQASRAGLARILLRARPILLLDEPFSALGPALKQEMLDLVGALAAETAATVLMVTHDPQDARHFADETIFVAEGRVFPPQETETLFRTPPPALAAYLGH